ncbi:MAG TPA: hypothetical protein PK662_07560 [Bacteroidales bacterium]|mgnify:FL=1|nr:hypothetical protein [Bacteroidales bacterium]
MKKKIIICIFIIIGSYNLHAQNPYDNSIGGIVGFLNGVSYKTFITDNLAFQVDFGFKSLHYAFGLEANVNLMYEGAIKDGFYWFAGAGISGGPAFGEKIITFQNTNDRFVVFKMGVNSIGGVEYNFRNIPLTLQADIRPGVLFYIWKGEATTRFDYNFLNVSARYTF